MTERQRSHDGATSAFASTDTAGVTLDDEGDADFDWDQVPTVRVDAPADMESAFDTDRFKKVSDVTVARPIKQPYSVGDEVKLYKKPAQELRRAAWTFENAPFTTDHPESDMVRDVQQIHGFWRNLCYRNDDERLVGDMYVPAHDEEARSFVADHQDVSIGFYNKVVSPEEYDGNTGSLTDDDVDGFQVDIYGDHIAAVPRGRCSREHGCGIGSVADAADGVAVPLEVDEGGMDRSVPEAAQSAAQDFLDAVDAGKVPDSCGGSDDLGRRRADMLAEGGDLSLDVWATGGTSAIANWHARHEGNEEYDEDEVDTPWEDCGYAMFHAWGGEAAKEKAMRLKEQVEESTDATTPMGTEEQQSMADPYSEGTVVTWQGGDARGEIVDVKTEGCFSDRIDGDFEICAGEDEPAYLIEEDDGATVAHKHGTLTVVSSDALDATQSGETPPGIYMSDGGGMFAIAPDEHRDDSTEHADDAKYPVQNCSDVQDAWHLRGHGDYDIEQSTLEDRIRRAAEALDCEMPGDDESMDAADTACGCDAEDTTEDMTEDGFDIPDVSIDTLAAESDRVSKLKEERDDYRETVDEVRDELGLDEAECPCDEVESLVDARDEVETLSERLDAIEQALGLDAEDADALVDEVEELGDEFRELRADKRESKLGRLAELGVDDPEEEWGDAPLDALDTEIERREEVKDALDVTAPTAAADSADESQETRRGARTFERGYGSDG